MRKSLIKAPVVALGAALAVSGCFHHGTSVGGAFDASKSFVETYDGYRLLTNEPFVVATNKPTGTVSYTGGILVERQPNVAQTEKTGLSDIAVPPEVEFIVGQLVVDVAFDDNSATLALSKFQSATAPISIFVNQANGNATALAAITVDDVTMGDPLDGTLQGTGFVGSGIQDEVYVSSKIVGELTSGSGEALKTYSVGYSSSLNLRGTAGNEFLLGGASLSITETLPGDTLVAHDLVPLPGPITITERYSGMGYAVQK